MKGPVICGIEDENDDGAAAVALDLADRYELELLFVHVGTSGEADEGIARLAREATVAGSAELVIEDGHPADRLVDLARDREAAFLVVGNHGPRSSLLGSVSADVSRRASCPVIVVPPTAEPATRVPDVDPDVRGGIVRFALGHAVRRVA